LMELYADATGCTVVEPLTDEAVLVGTGMVAATAAGLYPDLNTACVRMSRSGRQRVPDPVARPRFDRDYRVFLEMHRQRRALDALTEDHPTVAAPGPSAAVEIALTKWTRDLG